MANKVWAFVDQFKGQALPASWEVVYAGRKLADQIGSGLTALVIGSGIESLAKQPSSTAQTKSSWPMIPPWRTTGPMRMPRAGESCR